MVHVVSEQLGNYRLTHLLGTGASARVYLAEHLHLRTQVAIKVVDASSLMNDDLERFCREAQRISRLVHPHIVRVLEWDIQDHVPFLVMEYAPHGTLRQRHPKGTQVPLTTIASYVQQLASAIAYAHDQGLIHRDIKPENILIGRQNQLLLSDFGIAIAAQSEQSRTFQEAAGTIAYMAPEQLQQHPHMASDQYALGCMVYEWICGTPPFQGSLVEVIQHHRVTPPPPLWVKVPSLSPLVESVVVKALAKNPNDRFKSVQSFADTFTSACAANYDPSSPIRLVSETKRSTKDNRQIKHEADSSVMSRKKYTPHHLLPMDALLQRPPQFPASFAPQAAPLSDNALQGLKRAHTPEISPLARLRMVKLEQEYIQPLNAPIIFLVAIALVALFLLLMIGSIMEPYLFFQAHGW